MTEVRIWSDDCITIHTTRTDRDAEPVGITTEAIRSGANTISGVT